MTIQRDEILTCACDLYLADGVDGFSMRKLARQLGVTAPALYRHYESKEQVLVDLLIEAYKLMGQYLHRAFTGHTPFERFWIAGREYRNFALEHPRMYQAVYAAPDFMGLAERSEELMNRGMATGRFWNDRVRECMDEGILRKGDPSEIGLTLWAHAHGLISIYLRGICPMTEDEFKHEYTASCLRLMRGLAGAAYPFEEVEAGLLEVSNEDRVTA